MTMSLCFNNNSDEYIGVALCWVKRSKTMNHILKGITFGLCVNSLFAKYVVTLDVVVILKWSYLFIHFHSK